MKVRYIVDRENGFISMFDQKEGRYWRSMVESPNGKESPFMASFPHLIDIGIMGHCEHGISGLCQQSGVECYQNGPNVYQSNMQLEDFRRIAKQSSGSAYQFALGGRGDVDEHEDFEEILKACVENNIVPNFTTSGYGMNEKKAQICKTYCGAVAVSWYNNEYTYRAIKLLSDAKVKTNIHYVLSNSSIDEALYRIENKKFPAGINGIIFLLHKPVGLGSQSNVLKIDDNRVEKFLKKVTETDGRLKIGFDSCIVPAFVNSHLDVDFSVVETCEGARFSCYISPDLKMSPCSFDQTGRYVVDISENSLADGWKSEPFEAFRSKLKNSCQACSDRQKCMGGCPLNEEIVLCQRKERTKLSAEVL